MKSGHSVYSPGEFQRRGAVVAPVTYWMASKTTLERNCNGCGTGGWKGTIVPDTVYGLNIVDACQIHDWMYAEGQSDGDKGEADSVFLTNMLGLIEAAARASIIARLLAPFRRRRCLKYYEAVNLMGDDAFATARLIEPFPIEDITAARRGLLVVDRRLREEELESIVKQLAPAIDVLSKLERLYR